MAINREWSESYLFEQVSAMRWLREQGLDCEQIRNMRWGRVDESARTISVVVPVTSFRLDENGKVERETNDREITISVKGSGCEWYFLKSKFKCPWMFVRENPKRWNREETEKLLYSLQDVENFTKQIRPSVDKSTLDFVDSLTKTLEFDKMKVSILNITNENLVEPTGETTKT